jgi:signal peptidase II
LSTSATPDRRWLALLIAVLVVVIDRATKLWVVAHIPSGHAITVIPRVFRITHVLNTGAAFSMFEGAQNPNTVRYALIAFSLAAILGVLVALWRIGRTVTLTSVALSMILGGAIGNLYDRWRLHSVVDFLEVHIVHYHWPDFNAADSAIVVGACLLFLEVLRPQPGKA